MCAKPGRRCCGPPRRGPQCAQPLCVLPPQPRAARACAGRGGRGGGGGSKSGREGPHQSGRGPGGAGAGRGAAWGQLRVRAGERCAVARSLTMYLCCCCLLYRASITPCWRGGM